MTAASDRPTALIVCNMTDAPDTAAQRIARYQALFAGALVGRERTANGIRFRFAAAPGIEHEATELTALEQACCAFFTFTITRHGDEIWWDMSVPDDDIVRMVLDQFYDLPETAQEGAAAVHERFADAGLDVVVNDGASTRSATRIELGLGP